MPRSSAPVRRAARTVAVSASLLLAAAVPTASPARATAPEGWPAGAWGACADAAAQYCIEQATVTPAEGLPTPVADLGLTASVTTLGGDNGVTSINWAVQGWETGAEAALGGDVTLVVRTGQFVPRYTMALASDLRVARSTDEETGNSTLSITGRAVGIDWTTGDLFASCVAGADCGGLDTMADGPGQPGSGYRFSGNTQDLGTWGEADMANLDGMYIASDAQARPTTIMYSSYPEPYWTMPFLGNPHLDGSGNPVRGSFNAWLPESYFVAQGSTAEAAAAVGFDVVSREGAVSTSVPAEVTARDGGVAIDVKDLGYSVHQIDVFHRPASVDPDAGTPGVPQQVARSPSAGAVGVTWTAPASNGGSAVTGYTVRAFTAATGGTVAGRCTATTATSPTTSTACTISGLTNGTTYHLAASASNALGEGRAAPRVPVTVNAPPPPPAPTAPSAPIGLHLTPGNARLASTWTAPASTGGSPITGYTVRAYRTATGGTPVGTCTPAGSARTCTITGLANGITHYVGVRAHNAAGTGVESTPRVAAVPRTVASAPRTVSATSTARRIRVAWVAPAATGGSPVTGYRATAYLTSTGSAVAAQCTGTAPARSCTTAALTAGRAYYVSVVALNAAGSSAPSARVRILVRR